MRIIARKRNVTSRVARSALRDPRRKIAFSRVTTSSRVILACNSQLIIHGINTVRHPARHERTVLIRAHHRQL